MRAHVRELAYRHVGGTAVVLLYHRVATLERDPQLLAVTPADFGNHVAMLAERFRPISLDTLVTSLDRRRVPNRSVVVTFDDGYADNLLAAEPILSRHEVPATVFVSSGYSSGTNEFWWDEIERLVLDSADPLPEVICIEPPNARFECRISTTGAADSGGDPDLDWNVTLEPRSDRQRLYADLCAFLRPLPPADRSNALSLLRQALSAAPAVRDSHRPLTTDEVIRLDASAFVDVGGHTTSHPVLSSLSPEAQRTEITQDRQTLEDLCGREIRTFSYPYGDPSDYTDETVSIVRQIGYAGACSNHPGVAKPWTDPYRIPRHLVRNWDADTLAERIEGWFRGLR